MAPLNVAEVIAANMPNERSAVDRGRSSRKYFSPPSHHGEARASRVGVYVRNGVPRLRVYARQKPAYTRRRKVLPLAWSLSEEGRGAVHIDQNVLRRFLYIGRFQRNTGFFPYTPTRETADPQIAVFEFRIRIGGGPESPNAAQSCGGNSWGGGFAGVAAGGALPLLVVSRSSLRSVDKRTSAAPIRLAAS